MTSARSSLWLATLAIVTFGTVGCATASAQTPAGKAQPQAVKDAEGKRGHRGPHKMNRGPHRMFEEADGNKDGTVTREEASALSKSRFDRLDTNKDGAVTETEMSEARKVMRGANMANRFKQLDKNADGFLTQDEVPPRLAREFGNIDTNKDSKLSAEELQAGRERHGRPGPRGERGPRHNQGNGPMKFDKDSDGKVTWQEFSAQSEQWFGRLDRNSDGKITKDEIPSGRPRGRKF